MGHINTFFKPYSNELVYSWIHRLAKANGLSFRNFMINYMGKNMIFHGDFEYDIRYELMWLNEAVWGGIDLDDIYKHNTVQNVYNLALTEMVVERVKHNYIKPVSRINPTVRRILPKIKICPECLKEDECTILHVEHQEENVTMCVKHACKLMEFTGKKGNECEFKLKDYREMTYKFDEKTDYMLSKYISALCLSEVTASITDVKEVLIRKIKEKGYLNKWSDISLILNDIEDWKYKCLFEQKEKYLIEKIFPRKISVTLEQIIPFMMFIIPDVNILIKELPQNKVYFERRFCNICGEENIYSIYDDYICYKCIKRMGEGQEFTHLVKKMTNGQYEPLEAFVSMNKDVSFLHKSCGNIIRLKPRMLLYNTARCSCERKLFNEWYDVLVSYQKTIGSIDNITKTTIWEGQKLGQWVSITRRKAAKGLLTDNERVKLAEIGFTYKKTEKQWEESFNKYQRYILQTGDGHVPKEVIFEEFKLGQWYSDIKCAYSKGTLSEKRLLVIRKVYPLFPERPRKKIEKAKVNQKKKIYFDEAVELFLEYREKYKTQNIAKSVMYKEYKLGIWANQMRAKRKQGMLPKEQVEKLSSINFDWNPLETKWNNDLNRYQRYILDYGKPEVPRERKFEGFSLGYWYSNLKISYRNGSLTEEKINEIRNINPQFML